ncbi:hypothetical protein P43SY_000802 [Pythium insidiosum]|uniref:Phosphatidylinositol-4-phosphate 5 kinase-like protein n=1 Tax=Pythium insidiosum TaxID=114742 RepID=A0AAD5QBF9_PYTIN|nr:hypothetical protein P43SY_000802 [Pythium insidiosum]
MDHNSRQPGRRPTSQLHRNSSTRRARQPAGDPSPPLSRRAPPPVFLPPSDDRRLQLSTRAMSSDADLAPYARADSHNRYESLRTPGDATFPRDSQPASRRREPHKLTMRDMDESSEDSYDNGSLGTERLDPMQTGLGWFHNKITVDKAIHWGNNLKLQTLMGALFVGGAATTVALADNDAKASVGLLCGSLLTIVSCSAVLYTFLTRAAWKKHPNPLIFFRSLCDLGLVFVLVSTELYKCSKGNCDQQLSGTSCHATAGLTQLFLWGSESWFFVMAIDMYLSLKSPFTDYKRNVKRYHSFVWFTALLTAILLVAVPGFSGPSEFGYCWTASRSKVGKDPEDLEESKSNLWKLNFHYVIAIIIYWGLTLMIYVPYLIQGRDPSRVLVQLMNFMITCKGYFDFVVWFQMNEFNDTVVKATGKKAVDVDVDLSPQMNLALRCEVLYYTTTGIIQAVKDTQHLPPGATQQELFLQPQGTEENTRSPGVDDFMIRNRPKTALGKGTLFIDYCPHTFQTIREHFGIDTSQYIQSLSRTTKERLSEGASGAFMFFSHDQQLIVKSMSDEESAFLRSIAAEYASYLLTNPDSLLTRFYGCHAIRLYGNTFNFVVMANLFSTDKVIHRRYDIKGSWVNRSAKHPSKGKRVTCRHCNAKFVFGSTESENCPMRVGRHEANVVLKDNDLTAKVRLDPKVAEELYEQLVKDANFLSRLGIMDYSLLLGVHNQEYTVNPDETYSQDNYMPRTSRATKPSNREPGMRCVSPSRNPESNGGGLPRLGTGTRRANTVVGPSIYYFGLIDILQQWTMDKKLERFAKTKILGKDPDGLSAIPPTAYCDRFKRRMAEILSISVSGEEDDDGVRHSPNGVQTTSRFM